MLQDYTVYENYFEMALLKIIISKLNNYFEQKILNMPIIFLYHNNKFVLL